MEAPITGLRRLIRGITDQMTPDSSVSSLART